MVTTSLSLPEIARETRQASRQLAILTNEERNEALEAIAEALTANADKILAAEYRRCSNSQGDGIISSFMCAFRVKSWQIKSRHCWGARCG
jgi:glutamate-5-semialdehyde dehydrogenase